MPGGGGARPQAVRAGYHGPAIASGEVIAAHVAGRPDRAIATQAAVRRRRSKTAVSTRTSSAVTTSPPARFTPAVPPSFAPPSPTPALPASAAGLEARGHDLMVAGRYDQALPVLRRALLATGERPGACLDPTTQSCLTYAFALYDLGHSLRLAGRPGAAVRVLKHRLRIHNQRSVVATELARARRQARRRGDKHHLTG
jgi:hypothetical protein